MKRRTALKRLAAGAGSTFALVGAASASGGEPENLEPKYLVTEDGLEEIDDESVTNASDHCTVYSCCDCPTDCYDGCACVEPC